jgi:hypothetical protein
MRLFIFICRLIGGQAASRAKVGWAGSYGVLNVGSFNEFAGRRIKRLIESPFLSTGDGKSSTKEQ